MKFKDLFNRFARKSFFGFSKLRDFNLNWKVNDFLRAYEISAYVYAVVKKRAEKVGQVSFKLFKGDEEIKEHPLLNLLNKPNGLQSKNEFFELYQTYKDLTGSVYVYILRDGLGSPVELHLLRPDWIVSRAIDESSGKVAFYKYRPDGGDEVVFNGDDVIASHYPNPRDNTKGLSPLLAGALAVDTENQLSVYHNKVLKNGGKVEGIINYKTNLTASQIDEIREMFKKQYAGAENSGKPLITYGDAEYQNIGLTPSELSYIESKKMTRDDILLIYGVPKPIVAQTDDVNFASAKMAMDIFLSETIKPLIENLVNKLNEFLVPSDLKLSFVDPTPRDVELQLKKIDNASKNYYATINELRDMAGLEAIDGGDVILMPFNLVPLGEGGVDGALKMKAISHPLKNDSFRKLYFDNWLKNFDKSEKLMIRVVRKIMRDQAKRIIESLDSQQVKRKDLFSEVFNSNLEIKLTADAIIAAMERIYKEGGDESLRLFNVDDEFVLNSNDKVLIEKRANLFAEEVTKTTIKKLQREFEESFGNGESRQDLVKRIQNVYDGISKGRAMTIARTETLIANQSGKFSGYEKVGVGIKIWTSILDGRTRDSHVILDGEERSIRDRFSNGLLYPGDPSGSPDEVINCRCTI